MFNFNLNERTIDINEIDELIGKINLIIWITTSTPIKIIK